MKRRKVWLGAIVLALLVVGAAWQSGREPWARYVSPPLPDGTRFTLLHPARVKFSGAWMNGALFSFTDGGRPAPSGTLFQRYGWQQGSTVATLLQVIVNPLQARRWMPKEKRRARGDSFDAAKRVDDLRSKRAFGLNLHAPNTDAGRREEKIIFESFRVLPPGAPVPSP